MITTLPPAEWNDTARAMPDTLLHEALARQAARTPQATALRFRDEVITYAQLEERVRSLAARMAQRDAPPGSLVAVCMERSVELVVTLHAILVAGCVYVPIDPEYPDERVAMMLEDLDAPLVLTQPALEQRMSGLAGEVGVVDATGRLTGSPDPDPAWEPPDITADDLAYVIYTSGSTGRPKGAMIEHGAIANRIHWMQEYLRLDPSDAVLQKTPFSFDVSVWEFFWPLAVGAQLVVAEPGGHRDSGYLVDVIKETGTTTIHFVPSMLQLFLEDPRADQCTSLARVVCSGEALPRALQDRFFERLGAELHNLYGPTEAAVDVSAWRCDPSSDLPFVPIGKPVANTQLHILDEHLQPVPLGSAGELHIGGIQVGRGYLRRPELTAERFVADPFRAGGRLYRTGDLARYLPDGNIEFLGRRDFQVKIRGFRVELGEIEAALESIDGVRQAVVVADERPSGDLELVAYVSHAAGDGLPIEELRDRLTARLPEHMVPTVFVGMERFPLTANGKVDRSALPAPSRARPDLDAAYVAPRTTLERMITDSWQRILDVERVGVNDRFFELGGSSLQAARFVNQMQTALGESIFVVTLFSAPSVAEYAALLERQYPAAVTRVAGTPGVAQGAAASQRPITEADLDRLRSVVPTSPDAGPGSEPRNPTAIFILSPPRSGTTLLRIMLAGHRDLFAASELQLLGFATMQARAAAYSGRFSGWLDGAVRTVMELEGVDADGAKELISAAQDEGLTTARFFGRLQVAAEPRIVVDKSPSYALDPAALRRAEDGFQDARYIHLVRDPRSMIASFERHHMEQVLYLHDHDFDSRQLAELVWTLSHRTITTFLAEVPTERWHRMRYEDLVRDPAARMRTLCAGLGLEFDAAVVRPYEGIEQKMVDGVHRESAPMGDPNLLARGHIDASLAEAPESTTPLGEPTVAMAAELGYAIEAGEHDPREGQRPSLARQRERRRAARERRRG